MQIHFIYKRRLIDSYTVEDDEVLLAGEIDDGDSTLVEIIVNGEEYTPNGDPIPEQYHAVVRAAAETGGWWVGHFGIPD